MDLTTPLIQFPRAKRFLPKLKKLGIETVRDILYHFPSRYDDFSRITPVVRLVPGESCTVQGVVKSVSSRRLWKRRMSITEALISDSTGSVRALWFNQPYLADTLALGTKVNVAGVPSLKTGASLFMNPSYELPTGSEPNHTARIVPVYPQTKGLTSRGLRYLIQPLLEETYADPVPERLREELKLPEINRALKDVHFPVSGEETADAKRRFVFEELFTLQLYQTLRRRSAASRETYVIETDEAYLKTLIGALPFELTDSQKRALKEVCEDMAKGHPMRRLLQGDVGSGKTVIASLAALLAAKAGFQSALMAPTEVLAAQHFETLVKFFPGHERGAALLTSSRVRISYGDGLARDSKRSELMKKLSSGDVSIVVGTHALIQKYVAFRALALVIIDEQHRFGVGQRAALVKHRTQDMKAPHLLSMTATPIPRSLALTIWSDVDVSYLVESPKGRKRILTYVVPPAKRAGAYDFIRKRVAEGRQVFVICPRIEKTDGEETDVKTVTEEYEKLSKTVFPDLRVAMLHGRLPSKKKASGGGSKQEIMETFKEGAIDVLVSTSVIEVGIDVPNAAIMLVEGAERFGLAQLYQLRGRVGRGAYQSYCLLFTDSPAGDVRERLELVAKAKNGLELAEQDLRLRGPGEFFGTTQTGMPDLAMKAIQNPALAREARMHASELLDEDPKLSAYPLLQQDVKRLIASIRKE